MRLLIEDGALLRKRGEFWHLELTHLGWKVEGWRGYWMGDSLIRNAMIPYPYDGIRHSNVQDAIHELRNFLERKERAEFWTGNACTPAMAGVEI